MNIPQMIHKLILAVIFSGIAFLIVFFSVPSFLAIEDKVIASGEKEGYSFYWLGPKAIKYAYIYGSSCDNLSGTVIERNRGVTVKSNLDKLRRLRNWRENNSGQWKVIEEWKKEAQTSPKGKFFCSPHQSDIISQLNEGAKQDFWSQITLNSGTDLLYFDGKFNTPSPPSSPNFPQNALRLANGRVLKVSAVNPCTGNPQRRCADVYFDWYTSDQSVPKEWPLPHTRLEHYIVFCWDCSKLSLSAKDLQDSIMFEAPWEEFGLNGGYMIPLGRHSFEKNSERKTTEHFKRKFDFLAAMMREHDTLQK